MQLPIPATNGRKETDVIEFEWHRVLQAGGRGDKMTPGILQFAAMPFPCGHSTVAGNMRGQNRGQR